MQCCDLDALDPHKKLIFKNKVLLRNEATMILKLLSMVEGSKLHP